MDLTAIDPIWWVVLSIVIVILLAGIVIWSMQRKAARTKRLKAQFKSEYDRTTTSSGRRDAEEDLERRTSRRGNLDLVELTESDATSLHQQIIELRCGFVDGPQRAALGMTQLVERVAVARGYVAAESTVLDLVSVDHPEQVSAIRRSVRDMGQAKGANLTETSRQTLLTTEGLVDRLLAEGRAGQLNTEMPQPSPAAQAPQSNDPIDAPPPPLDQDEPQTSKAHPNNDEGSAFGPQEYDHTQETPTVGR